MKQKPRPSLLVTLLALPFSPAFAQSPAQPAASVEVLATFAYPTHNRQPITLAEAISNTGVITGDVNMQGVVEGYTRSRNGKLSKLFQASTADTIPQGINTSGLIAGYTQDIHHGTFHGFFYQDGVATPYDVPGSIFTFIYGLNDAGDFTGRYGVAGGSNFGKAFASIGGTLVDIVVGEESLAPRGINNSGAVVGWYTTTMVHGFLWHPDGSVTYPIDFPGATVTILSGINDQGTIAGSWTDSSSSYHAFVLQRLTQFTEFEIPGSISTYVTGINNAGLITGYYGTGSGTFGFLARLVK